MLLSYKCYSSTSEYLLLKADTARKDGVSFVMAEGLCSFKRSLLICHKFCSCIQTLGLLIKSKILRRP